MQMNRVRVVWSGVAGGPAYTNLYSNNGLVSASTAHAGAAAWVNAIKGLVTTAVTATIEGDVALVESTTDTIVGVSTVPQVSYLGTGSGNRLPPANQIVTRLLTGAYAGGRQVRGRIFLPYLTVGNQASDGQVIATSITTANSAWNTYTTALGAGAAVVFSRVNGTGYAIVTYSVWNQFGVMRSRRD